MNSVQQSARWLRWVALVSAVFLAGLAVWGTWMSAAAASTSVSPGDWAARVDANASGEGDWLVVALTGFPLAYALWRLGQMLAEIQAGELFSVRTIDALRAFAFWVLLTAALTIIVPPFFSVAGGLMTIGSVRHLTLRLDGGDIFILFVSAILFLIARLLSEAQRVAEENRKFL